MVNSCTPPAPHPVNVAAIETPATRFPTSANIRLWKKAVAQAEKDHVMQALIGLPVEGGRSW